MAGQRRSTSSRRAIRPHWFSYSSLMVWVVAMLVVLGCRASHPDVVAAAVGTAQTETSRGAATVAVIDVSIPSRSEGGSGLNFSLSEGSKPAAELIIVPPAAAAPLPVADLTALLALLPALQSDIGDVQPFRLPTESLPAPRPGETITQTFPPQAADGEVTPPPIGPLTVLRYSPEGDLPLVPYLSVTFSQPMVALTGHADLAAEAVPVRLTPQPEGRWRWVGTQTLIFEPTLRFPMATRYTVEVAAGTTSAVGGTLADAVAWSFTTPPPQMQRSYPTGGPHVRNPLIFVGFDQQIDAAAMLETISVRAGGRAFALQMVAAAEVIAHPTVGPMATDAGAGRWLAFRSAETLPYNSTVTVDIGPGSPSAEGARQTEQVQSFTFTTYGAMQVQEHGCSWGNQCPPLTPWYVRFSNAINAELFDSSMVVIEPELPGAKVEIYGNTLNIVGRSQGRTTYQVILKAGLPDRFGQFLEADATLSFRVGSAEPNLYAPGDSFVVLDPASQPTYSVFTVNFAVLKVQAYSVTPADWPRFQNYMAEFSRTDTPPTPPGTLALNTRLRVNAQADQWGETVIDLSQVLPGGVGHTVLVIEPDTGLLGTLFGRRPPVAQLWVQATQIGLDAFVDARHMVAWANSLRDGSPLVGVELSLTPGSVTARTGADGLVKLPLSAQVKDEGSYLVARLGSDSAILPENKYWWGGAGWRQRIVENELRWYVFDDRQLYRPGEELHVKGWMRQVEMSPLGDVGAIQQSGGSVSYQLTDSRGNQILNGRADLDLLGGFDLAFTLPQGMNLGGAELLLNAQGVQGVAAHSRQYYHRVEVQEFRRPEFEVKATTSPGPYFVGETAVTQVEANYFAGGPLAGADVYWQVTSTPGSFRPPNWDEFTFGIWTPWWGWYDFFGGPQQEGKTESFVGKTDAGGTHALGIAFESVDPPQATSVRTEATVMDVNRQAWTATASLLVHPADLYVGLRTERVFVQQADPLPVEAIVVDLDGKPIADVTVEMRAARLDWVYRSGEWQEKEAELQLCSVVSGQEPVQCTFQTAEGGTYRITATIVDGRERPNMSQLTRWVSGSKRPTANQVEQEQLILIPDRQSYQPGQSAEILVQAPFAPAEGVVTLRRSGIVETRAFYMDEPTYTLQVPIQEAYIPNITVQVDLVGAAPRLNSEGEADPRLPKRPAFASGALNLSVPPLARTLTVAVTPQQSRLEPGGETVVDLLLTDAAGQPVPDAQVAVVVVDEAVLALTNYQLADPISIFYSQRGPDTGDYHLRSSILLVDPDRLLDEVDMAQPMATQGLTALRSAAAPEAMESMAEAAFDMGRTDDEAAASQGIRLRSDFNPLATFAPAVPTDGDGRAAVTVKLPDNLTRYRVMVVAVSGGKWFGSGESTITARLPLMVRPSAPRFLNFGDRIELPIVVQNQTDEPLEVDVALSASNVTLTAGAGRRVTVPANDRVEVRFPTTTESAGTARFLVGVRAGSWADAASFELPVYTPATSEAFAVYGTVERGAIAQPVIAPTDVYTQFGGLEITASSTALQALTDAVLYLTSYRYECSEQLASRILAVAALRDVLSAFQAEGLPEPAALIQAVQRDIAKLQGLQNSDGGFPIWVRGQESWPFYSIHVAHALIRAQQKEFEVPAAMLSAALDYLRNVEAYYPSWYSRDVRNTVTAYALSVRKQMGDVDTVRARRLIADNGVERLSLDAVGWLLYVLSDDAASTAELTALRRHLGNRVVETAGAANFTTSYREDDGYLLLASNRRTDGIILDALLVDQPGSDLIPKVVRGLLAHRTQGRWGNTQENVFILLAMDRYFNTFEAQTPDFVARAWLGEQYVAGFQFEGRSTDYQSVQVPMSFLADQTGVQDLVLSQEGDGRLYYRLGLRYAPTSLELAPLDQGFTVERIYEAVDDPADVRQDEEGVWHVRAGARVRVKLTMVATNRRYHVALVDPMPAGLESLNPSLAVTGSIPQDPANRQRSIWWWWSSWYEHQNLRDDRAEAFASLLWEGIYTYSYVARATTPGEFVVPPAKAEEMYAPEVFGRSGSDRMIVE